MTDASAPASESSPPEHQSLSDTLTTLLATPEGEPLRLGTVFERVGEKGFGLLLVVLSLPSALPLPAAGYSVPFGIILMVLGAQMIAGRTSPWLPAKSHKISLPRGFTEKMLSAARWAFRRLEHLIRPRFRWVGQRPGRILMGFLVCCMATLMMVPIPTTNTAPAGVIFLIGVGLCEEDGLFAAAACLAGIAAVLLYAVVLYFAWHFISEYGWEGLANFTTWLKEQLGLAGS